VSADGQHWKTLKGSSTTDDDPNGANYGNGYTGKSGVPASDKKGQAKWVQERIDLSEFAGKKIQLRFEYITDAGVTHAGFFVDDIEIPEIAYRYEADMGDGGWEARGFIRHTNVLPQRWLVQLITLGKNGATVERLPVEQDQTGRWNIHLGSDVDKAVIVVNGLTPGTTETARYWFAVSQK